MVLDLGYFGDDHIGVDTTRMLAYTYNGFNVDVNDSGYGEAPPAAGVLFLRTPHQYNQTTQAPLSGFREFTDGPLWRLPQDPDEYYYTMQGRARDGSFFCVWQWPHYCRQSSSIAEYSTFLYPGDPVTGHGWSAMNTDGLGNPTAPSDRYWIVGAGPFGMEPGEVDTVDVAFLWARGTDHLDSVTELRKATDHIRRIADILYTPTVSSASPYIRPTPLTFGQNYPNPFTDRTTITYSLAQSRQVRLTVHDVLGREVATLAEGFREAGSYEAVLKGSDLSPGMYLYRLELDGFYTFSKRMVRL